MFKKYKGKKFNLIYADPAWQFSNVKTGGSMTSGASHQYKSTMSIADLKSMPIDDIAADDCILVMWYVGSMAQEALDVVKAWGFDCKNINGFVWNKLTVHNKPFFGMGFWTRAGSESAIVATRGKPKVADHSIRAVGGFPGASLDEVLGIQSFIGSYQVREHSRKPDEFRNLCADLAGEGPKIELFSRGRYHGWSVWGNEIGKNNPTKKQVSIDNPGPNNEVIYCANNCGVTKVVRKIDLARGWGTYCSKSCKAKHASEAKKTTDKI